VREILRGESTGTPVMREGHRVGVMPDLERIAEAVPGLTDIYIRDAQTDTWSLQSPDIIVRTWRSRDPERDFGDASGKADTMVRMPRLQPGREHFVYVRVGRRLGSPQRVRVSLFSSAVATSPEQFQELEPTFVDLSAGRTFTVAGPIRWRPSAEQAGLRGSGCFVAVLDHAEDPAPDLLPLLPPAEAELSVVEQTRHFVRGQDNVAWRTYGPNLP
jgi:hypothetical protein